MTRILVCGGRYWDDQTRVDEVLDRLHAEYGFTALIQGGQMSTLVSRGEVIKFGADYQAKVWAEKRGVPVIEEKANWAAAPRGAGMIRNSKMLRVHKPTLGVGFKGGSGTEDMLDKMRAAGVPVLEFDHTD